MLENGYHCIYKVPHPNIPRPENFVEYQKRNLPAIKTLKEYQYVDETGHDQGANGIYLLYTQHSHLF